MNKKMMISKSFVLATIVVSIMPLLTLAASDSFVPLTALPQISEIGNSPTSLPNYLNSIYKICIGIAATAAVIQIMRAGFLFMTGKGSISANEAGKSLLGDSILGLILVLSPAIVFGIINPKILDLNLDFSRLKTSIDENTPSKTVTTPAQFSTYIDSDISAKLHCTDKGGTIVADNSGEITCSLPSSTCPDFNKPGSITIVGEFLESCCKKTGCVVNKSIKQTRCDCDGKS